MKNKKVKTLVMIIISMVILLPINVKAKSSALLGDINKDGLIDSKDLLTMIRHIAGENDPEHSEWIIDGEKYEIADMTKNGVVNGSDLLVMLRYLAAKNNQEEIGSKHPEWMKTLESEITTDEEQKEDINPTLIKIGIANGEIGSSEVEVNKMEEYEEGGITLSKKELNIKTNEICKLEATLEQGIDGEIIWETDNKDVVDVYNDGMIIGKKAGTATISVKVGKRKAKCKVTVVERAAEVERIVLSKKEIELEVGEKGKIEAKIEPETAKNKEITYRVGNSEIATVEQDGTVTGKKAGTTSVVATSEKRSEVCVIKVKEKQLEVEELAIEQRDTEIEKGETTKLAILIKPKEAVSEDIEIESENDNVTIDRKSLQIKEDGKAEIDLIGKKEGETTITVRLRGKSASCKVRVKEIKEIKVNEIKLDKTEITMQENQLRRLTAKIEPKEAESKEIIWESSNKEVATVDSNGLVTGKKAGEATITAKIGDKKASCIVKVEKEKQIVLGVSLSKSNVELKEGDKVKITASIAPKEASNKELGIKIDNDNASVEGDYVTVNEEGKADIEITGKKAGKAVLTVTSGAIKKECEIIVKVKDVQADKLVLNEKNISLYKNQTVKLTAKTEPVDMVEGITWTSANEKIATVDKEGKVTAKNIGNTEIIAKTQSGLEEKCKVTVKIKPTGIKITKASETVEMETLGGISALITPSGSDIKDIEWTNSNQENLAVERIIENGTYYIKSAINEKKVLDVKNGSTANKAAIQIFDRNETEAQKFEISSAGGEYYTIKSKKSGKVVDVKNEGKVKGTKVQQYTSNGTDAQKWEFEYAGGGKYYIKSKVNGLYLDVPEGKATNERQLNVWTENRSNAQKFKLEQIDKKAQVVENGTYYIKSAVNNNRVLDVENASEANKAPIQLFDKNNSDAQKFEITCIGNGYYVIRARSSGKAIDVKNGGKDKGTKIQQYSYNSTDAQVWKIEKDGDNYKFKSKSSGLYLDVPEGKADNRKQLQIYTGNSTKAQKFKLEKESDETKLANIEYTILKGKKEGKATITAKLASGNTAKCTVVVKSSKITGGQAIAEAAVQLACSVAPQQGRYKVAWPWTVERNSRTSFYIDTRDKYIKGSYAGERNYASCDVGVATAIRYAGVDKNMEWRNIPIVWQYVPHSWESVGSKKNGWKKIGYFKRGTDSTSKLQPGDVLLSGDPYYGHIWLYVGNETVRKKYPKSNADGYESGYWTVKGESYYPHLFNIKSDSRHRIPFTIFRHENANKRDYDKILK